MNTKEADTNVKSLNNINQIVEHIDYTGLKIIALWKDPTCVLEFSFEMFNISRPAEF